MKQFEFVFTYENGMVHPPIVIRGKTEFDAIRRFRAVYGRFVIINKITEVHNDKE